MTTVVHYIVPGTDCPEELAGSAKFMKAIEDSTRRRLELRPEDRVIVFFKRYVPGDQTKIQEY